MKDTTTITVQVPVPMWDAALTASPYTPLAARIREGLVRYVRTGQAPSANDSERVAHLDTDYAARTVSLPRALRDALNATCASRRTSAAAVLRMVLIGEALSAKRNTLIY